MTPEVLETITKIGMDRMPAEACGILLPYGNVIELFNVAELPHKSFRIDRHELTTKIEDWLALHGRREEEVGVVVWHTHPSGLVGPSDGDMDVRRQYRHQGYEVQMLVVALPSGLATRF